MNYLSRPTTPCVKHLSVALLHLILGFMVPWTGSAGTEYFIAVSGSDANSGLAQDEAFATLQFGLSALQAGDTLTMLPGEYLGSARIRGLGDERAVTTIRAMLPGTVVVRGDVDAPAFEKTPGYRFVYSAPFEPAVYGVNELDTLSVYREAASVGELETTPGAFYHDAAGGRLYISTSDFRSADNVRISFCVIPDHGLHLAAPRRVHISGIDFRGFQQLGESDRGDRAGNATFGVFISDGFHCVIQDCRAYFNNRGIGMSSAGITDSQAEARIGNNLIQFCQAWANRTIYGWGGAVNVFSPRYDQIRHCRSFLNSGIGLRMYQGDYYGLTYKNLAWGNGIQIDLKAHASVMSYRNVGVGVWGSDTIRRRVIKSFVGAIQATGEQFAENIILRDLAIPPEQNPYQGIDLDVEFSDPDNNDFRLQSTSRFRGAATDGSDLGAFEFTGEVVFVAPDGDDAADGLSAAGAWQTLKHVASQLRAGQTLYLAPGVYRDPLVITGLTSSRDEPLRIRTRGRGRAVLAQGLRLEDCAHVEIERIDFEKTLSVSNLTRLVLTRSRLADAQVALSLAEVHDARLLHNDFKAQTGLMVSDSSGLFIAGNDFRPAAAAVVVDDVDAVRYADYNTYAEGAAAWRTGGRDYAPGASPHVWEKHSVVRGPDQQPGAGAYGRMSGVYRLNPARLPVESRPELHRATATTANIEWYSSYPGAFTVGWGATPDATNRAVVYGETFATFSLTDLQPDTTYYFRLLGVQGVERGPEELQTAQYRLETEPLCFSTAAADRDPTVFFIDPQGDDSDDGLAPQSAWRTFHHAAGQLQPGDTLQVLEGRYAEKVRIRGTGTADAPITLRAASGARVVFDADGKLPNFFVIDYKKHVRLDGFYMQAVSRHTPGVLFGSGGVRARGADDLQITRCMLDGRRVSYSGPLAAIYESTGVLIKNSVQVDNMGGMRIVDAPGLRIANCVFLRSKISPMEILNRPGQPAVIKNTIFTDALPRKANSLLIAVGYYPMLETINNGYFFRLPATRPLLGVYGEVAYERAAEAYRVPDREDDPPHPIQDDEFRRVTVQAWHHNYFQDGDYLEGDPEFAILARHADEVAAARAATAGRHPPWLPIDWLCGGPRRVWELSFKDLCATNPDYLKRDIGLQPSAFDGFE